VRWKKEGRHHTHSQPLLKIHAKFFFFIYFFPDSNWSLNSYYLSSALYPIRSPQTVKPDMCFGVSGKFRINTSWIDIGTINDSKF
jgi:hypothetical protein